jgi:hypothetical protein
MQDPPLRTGVRKGGSIHIAVGYEPRPTIQRNTFRIPLPAKTTKKRADKIATKKPRASGAFAVIKSVAYAVLDAKSMTEKIKPTDL